MTGPSIDIQPRALNAGGPARIVTLAGFRHGVALTAPVLPGCFFFGAGFGALAAQKGMTLAEATLFSLLTFAGAAQFAAMETWKDRASLAGLVALALVVGVVNLRFVLMGAALRPWLEPLPPRFVYSQFVFLTDLNFVVASRYRMQNGVDAGVLVGSGFVLWATWTIATIPGFLIGAVLQSPQRFGFDLMLPIIFGMTGVSLWRSRRAAICWAVAGAAALIAMRFIPGQWHVMIGALAGMLVAAFFGEDEDA